MYTRRSMNIIYHIPTLGKLAVHQRGACTAFSCLHKTTHTSTSQSHVYQSTNATRFLPSKGLKKALLQTQQWRKVTDARHMRLLSIGSTEIASLCHAYYFSLQVLMMYEYEYAKVYSRCHWRRGAYYHV